MLIFNFPQFKHEPSWSYFQRLNDYRAQLNQNFEKKKIYEVIVVGLNFESRGYVESMCPRGLLALLSRTQEEVWDFFEKLAWDTYEFEQARNTLGYPTPGESPQDHFIDSHDSSHSYFPHVLCYYCESSDHDVHTCPYRDCMDAT